MAKRGYNRVCAAFGGADVVKKGFLEKLPLNLNDTHVVTIAQEYGWQDQWMAKAEKKRGRQQALDNAAAAASGDVGAMLRVATGSAQQQQSAGNGPQVEGNGEQAAASGSTPQPPSDHLAAPKAAPPQPQQLVAPVSQASQPAAVAAPLPAAAAFVPHTPVRSHRRRREEQPPAAAEMDSHAAETPAPMTSSKSGPPQPPADLAATHICGICLEPMERGEPLTALQCMHVFHKACVDEWRQVAGIVDMARCPSNCHRSAAIRQHAAGINGMFARQALHGGEAHASASNDGWEMVPSENEEEEGFGVGAAAETANGEVGSDVSSGSD